MEINDSQDEMRYDDYNPTIDISYFYNLDSENKICFDCGGAFPTCVSINNGVFLCQFCGENHRNKLNYNISYIREINAPWDEYLLSYATRGGNTRFKRLCLQYEVPCQSLSGNNDEKLNKYLIRLGEYNRLLLKSEVNCDEPPQPLYNEVAKDPINENIIYFPEFKNYQIFKGHFVNKGNNKDSNSVGNKIWEGTKTTFDVMKTTSGFIYNTSKPIVSFLGKTAFSGLKYVGSSVWNYINKTDEAPINEDTITDNNNTNQNNPPNNMNNINNFEMNKIQQNNNYNNQNNNYNNQNNNHRKNNYYNNPSIYLNNKTYLINSNKHNIYTINDSGIQNNNNNMISKPINNKQLNQKDCNLPYFYDINSINSESANNISFHLNNNNTLNNISKSNKLIEHENIIANQNIINNNNFLINKGNKKYNNLIIPTDDINNKDSNKPNNNLYPSFSNQQKDDNILFRQINDINVPNIIGEEIDQQKGGNPILQSSQLLENNSFQPAPVIGGNEVKKNDEDSNYSIIPN